MKTRTKITIWALIIFAAVIAAWLAHGQSGGKLTGVVRGMDEEAKVVNAIENARTFDFRLHVAFYYVEAELDKREESRKEYSNKEHLAAMDHNIVVELRRAMLCEDAPKWVKEQREDTIWWGTNRQPAYSWRWEPTVEKERPNIDWNKVDERDIP